MVRPDVAARKITRASAWLDDAEAILSWPVDEFVGAAKDRDLAAFYLLLAIQESIDLAAHWVADAGWGAPNDAASTGRNPHLVGLAKTFGYDSVDVISLSRRGHDHA